MVVGSGIAGLYAALLASDPGSRPGSGGGPAAEVVLLTKGALEESNTFYAQGGVSAVLAPEEAAPGDSVAAHIADTLAAGAGLNNPDAVRILCTEAVRDIAGLRRFGVDFDLGADGGPALGLEAAHSAARILHAGGDATGARIARALVAAVLDRAVQGKLRVETGAFVTELLTGGTPAEGAASGAVTGVAYLAGGVRKQLDADAVLLATGGAGRLFARTSNPSVATADGLALAWRAGAAVRDLEFFQFHPTTLAANELPGGPPALLISEAVRGEGAVLLDAAGYRFMPDYHPDAELAPRDIVARAVYAQTQAGLRPALDTRQAIGPRILSDFPAVAAACLEAGLDPVRDPIPVAAAAHYHMGGIAADGEGRTSLPGLWACGEVASTGLHGANRLASNGLLEALVYARRCALAIDAALGTATSAEPPVTLPDLPPATAPDPALVARLRRSMTDGAGVIRTAGGLQRTLTEISEIEAAQPGNDSLLNMTATARLIVTAALLREESRGAHFRDDFPQADGTGQRSFLTLREACAHPAARHPEMT